MSLSRKQLGEILIHPAGDATMLTSSKRCQLATIAFGIFPHLRQTLADVLAQLGQTTLILKLLVDPLISAIVGQPS